MPGWDDTEVKRLAALRALDILDSPAEESFDRYARLAGGLFGVPVARVSLIDEEQEFLKAAFGCERTTIERDKSFCTWTVAQDAPLIVPDLKADLRFADNPRVRSGPRYRFYVGAQLRNRDGLNLGALCCLDTVPQTPSAHKVRLLQDLAQVVVEAMELRRVATTDSLTGAMVRRAFLDTATREIARARRKMDPLTCVMLDIDHFKRVNDTYGHAVGDEVLRRVSAVCRQALRAGDGLGRLGGEEFAVLLPDTDGPEALEIAERLRAAISSEAIAVEGAVLQVTASLGVASLRPDMDAEALFAKADAALYAAKHAGRDCTIVAETGAPVMKLRVA